MSGCVCGKGEDCLVPCDNCDRSAAQCEMTGGYDQYTPGFAPQAVPLTCPTCNETQGREFL